MLTMEYFSERKEGKEKDKRDLIDSRSFKAPSLYNKTHQK